MLLWGRCRADAVFGVRKKRRRFNVCVRTQLTNLVPKGRLRMPQDASPGCTWTAREWRLATWAGCLESRIVHLRVRGTPGLHPGAFSAVPTGLIPVGMYTQDSRPGLLSAVPFDKLRAGSAGFNFERVVLTHTGPNPDRIPMAKMASTTSIVDIVYLAINPTE